jgi:hypothetical protein
MKTFVDALLHAGIADAARATVEPAAGQRSSAST